MSRLANSSVLPEARPRASRVICTRAVVQPFGDVERRAVAFEVGVGGHDQLADRPRADAGLEGVDGQLLGPHALERGEAAQQDVIDALIGPGLLHGQQVARLLDHADDAGIAPRVAADRTDGLLGLGEMKADLAVPDLVLGRADRLGQLQGLLVRALEEMMGQPLGRLGADPGQAAQGRVSRSTAAEKPAMSRPPARRARIAPRPSGTPWASLRPARPATGPRSPAPWSARH